MRVTRGLVVLFAVLLLGLASGAGLLEAKTVRVLEKWKAPESAFENGILKQVVADDGSTQQHLLELKGTHRQMGYAHGYLMAPEIWRYYKDYYQAVLFTGSRPAQLQSEAIWDILPEKYRSELTGMLDGMTDRINDLRRGGGTELTPLTRNELIALQCEPEVAGFACTSIASWGPRTAGGSTGQTLISRSVDWVDAHPMRLFSTYQGTITFESTEGGARKVVGASRAGLVGIHTGFNDSSFFIEMNYAPIIPIRAGAFYPCLLYYRHLLETVDGQSKDSAAMRAQIDPVLGHPRIVATVQPMVAWVPASASDPSGGVAVIEGVGTPAGPLWRAVGWSRENVALEDGSIRVRFSVVPKLHSDGTTTFFVTDGTFLGETRESPPRSGSFEVADQATGERLLTYAASDLVMNTNDPARWVYARASGVGGRFRGRRYRIENANQGYFCRGDDIGRLVGLGASPPAAFNGVCAFMVDAQGRIGSRGYWISSGLRDPDCGRVELEPGASSVENGVSVVRGQLRYSNFARPNELGQGTYANHGNIALSGDYQDARGARAGTWFAHGNADDAGVLVNVNAWFLAEAHRYTVTQTDCLGGAYEGYRLNRALLEFSFRTNFTAESHHEVLKAMYRNHLGRAEPYLLAPNGSVCAVTYVPAQKRFRVSYSLIEPVPGDGTGANARRAYATFAPRVKPIEFVWTDFFAGIPPAARPLPVPGAAAGADATAGTGTPGRSNPTLGQ